MTPYHPPVVLFNNHLETIYPALFRKVKGIFYQRERIQTPDHDFLDIDWLTQNSTDLVVLSHGLEGNTQRAYIKGMAKVFYKEGYDVLAWNYRGCSEEMNHQLRFYHSGATDDLGTVIQHALGKGKYKKLSLISFSLGGNLTLKYLGEQGNALDARINRCVAFSVPLDLHKCCLTISLPGNWPYAQRFIKSLKKKVIAKSLLKPELDIKGIDKINGLIAFDNEFTAPLHGFKNALEYYERCSAIHFVDQIRIPTLIVNALNDPFLNHEAYASSALLQNPYLQFETPARGGHVGFTLFNQNGVYWSELRALSFILQNL